MRSAKVKKEPVLKDDSLFGLLSPYKSYNTYLRILADEDMSELVVVITRNPGFWKNIPAEQFGKFKPLKRLDIGTNRLFVKYILPEHLIKVYGPAAGIKIASDKITVEDMLSDRGLYIIRTSSKNSHKVFNWVKRTVNLTPQRKYEIHEICIAENQE
jgi:hypothetical protein